MPVTPSTTKFTMTADYIDRLEIQQNDIYVNSFQFRTQMVQGYGGVYYIPADDIAARLNCSYQYDSGTKQLQFTDEGTTIQMTVGSDKAKVNGTSISCPEPFVKDEVVYAPIKFVGQKLGCIVTESNYEEYSEDFIDNGLFIFSPKPMDLQFFDQGDQGQIYSKIATKSYFSLSRPYLEQYYAIAVPQFSGLKNQAFEQQLNSLFETVVNQAVQEAEDTAQRIISDDGGYYTDQHYYLKHLRHGVLSLTIYIDVYTAGAHSNQHMESYTIDLNKGKILTLDDLFVSNQYPARLVEEAKEIYEGDLTYYELKQLPKVTSESGNFYLEDGRIVFYYDPYDLDAYGRGFVYFEAPLKNLSDVVNEEYKMLMK